MGICSSSDATNVATVKLILLDGRLQEFPYPVKASHVLPCDGSFFICNSDDMEFDDVVSAVEELHLGGLYFALPASKMKRKLQAEEMAALAVKASSALTRRCGGDRRSRCRKKVMDFSAVVGGRDGADVGRRRRFAATLGSIPE
ncbi:hypothetical protein MLD38_030893 [Melastoma candidum]|uniref:Uncharacterized protein n=1 Tax=Melastoma candidum TaxID=119954 RepID=A0ACB9MPL2_9MYRT|nr:hypothetical protein MLD38_030893 [Melastoma candidum]